VRSVYQFCVLTALLLLIHVGPLGAQDWEQASVQSSVTDSLAPETLDDCQVVARIDGQVVLACDLLWQANRLIEENRDRIPPEKEEEIRQELMKRFVASMVDTKLLYASFLREVPAENIPTIEENLREPFQKREVPTLMKQLKVDDERALERELLRLGSSLESARRAFNEKAMAGEWLRSKVKVNEEITPADLLEYYQAHLADYEYPSQARWEELMVRKDRFQEPRQAYAELAKMGNEVWQKLVANPNNPEPVFGEVAKAKSDGFTAKDGGVYDWTTKGALKADVLDEALFTLEVGRLSQILDSGDAFHIVRVLERKEAGRTPFTDVQADIRDALKQERFRAAVEKYLANLHRAARIWTIYTGPVSADVLMGKKPDETKTQ
jgi:PPIC-type PPIASE domain